MAKPKRQRPVPAQPKSNALADMIRHYLYHPVDFVKEQFDATPDPWQAAALETLAPGQDGAHAMTAIKSGHGVGKTTLESWTILYFLLTRPNARIPCTAPSQPQLNSILWPEIAAWIEKCKLKDLYHWTATKVAIRGHEEKWFAIIRTAAKPESLQGFHGNHLLWILDEASGIDDAISEVIEGSLTSGEDNKVLACGNPTQLSGLFHRAFNQEAVLWNTFTVSCMDSPRVDRAYIERMRRWGEDSDIYRVRVLGEFPKGGLNTFFRFDDVARARHRDATEGEPVELGVDVARFGDDSTVFATRKGMVCLPLEAHGGWDTVQTSDRAAEIANEHGVTTIRVDDTGVGGGVTDNLRRLKRERKLPQNCTIVPVNNGAAGDEHYANMGARVWGHLGDMLAHISLPDDEELFAQLTDRRKVMTPNGKIGLEPKLAMKHRGRPSPDRADAVALAFFDAEIKVDAAPINKALNVTSQGLWSPSKWRVPA